MRFCAPTLAALLLLSGAARAGFVTYSGTIMTSDPTFDRPVAYVDGTQSDTFLDYSSQDHVFYNVQPFTVTESDVYTVTARTSLNPSSFVLTLYSDAFDPTDSAVNYVSNFRSQGILSYALDPGTEYFLVTAPVNNGDTGDYTVTISATTTSGTPVLGAVPEPTSLVLLGGGAFCLIARARRRRGDAR